MSADWQPRGAWVKRHVDEERLLALDLAAVLGCEDADAMLSRMTFAQWDAWKAWLKSPRSRTGAATRKVAASYGLQVGEAWARSVVSGADTVLTPDDFMSLKDPQFGSALAQSSLGEMGLQSPAGSGAKYYNVKDAVNIVSIDVSPDGKIIDARVVPAPALDKDSIEEIVRRVVDEKLQAIAKTIGGQRG